MVGQGKEGRWCTNGREEGLGVREEEEATCLFGGGVRGLGGVGGGGVGGGWKRVFRVGGGTTECILHGGRDDGICWGGSIEWRGGYSAASVAVFYSLLILRSLCAF